MHTFRKILEDKKPFTVIVIDYYRKLLLLLLRESSQHKFIRKIRYEQVHSLSGIWLSPCINQHFSADWTHLLPFCSHSIAPAVNMNFSLIQFLSIYHLFWFSCKETHHTSLLPSVIKTYLQNGQGMLLEITQKSHPGLHFGLLSFYKKSSKPFQW